MLTKFFDALEDILGSEPYEWPTPIRQAYVLTFPLSWILWTLFGVSLFIFLLLMAIPIELVKIMGNYLRNIWKGQ